MLHKTYFDETLPNSIFHQLSIKQQNAILLLLEGKSITEIASAIDVGRDTIWRWRNHNPKFMAAVDELSNQSWQSLDFHMNSLLSESIATIKDALKSENKVEVAISFIKALFAPSENMNLQPKESDLETDLLKIFDLWTEQDYQRYSDSKNKTQCSDSGDRLSDPVEMSTRFLNLEVANEDDDCPV
ncbi:hypothetical protein B7486_49325 [cyanobacterium TDX16]|nr:hypothetical protein B7486_49325 [cyanobacterium TDX16]